MLAPETQPHTSGTPEQSKPQRLGSQKPILTLPPRVPPPRFRPVQSNIPSDRATRDRLKKLATDMVAAQRLVPPVPMVELREHAATLR